MFAIFFLRLFGLNRFATVKKNRDFFAIFKNLSKYPRLYAKWKLSWNICTLHTGFCTFGTNLYAPLVLTNKVSASELSWKFIKSALLVG